MNILIRNVRIISKTKIASEVSDILIEDGVIQQIGTSISVNETNEFDAEGAFISAGWCDTFCSIPDPGFEYKEDLISGLNCAAEGGYTTVAILPDTFPVVHNKTGIEYWLNNSRKNIVTLLPLGSVTMKCEGKDPSEMLDMHKAGAVGFTDAYHPIQEAGILMRSLQYSLSIGVPVYNIPFDESMCPEAMVHEGDMSTNLGLRGIPSMAEEIMLIRDINLAEYTGAHIHVPVISTARSVQLIADAKQKGINITCGVSAFNLLYDDSMISEFDSNWKLMPPLRTKEDSAALRLGVMNGTIDVISSGHRPQHTEGKQLEFEYAEYGMINLQTCFSICLKAFGNVDVQWINAISTNGYRMFSIDSPLIEVGSKANFSIFNLKEWSFNTSDNQSKSNNSALLNSDQKGKAIAIINNNQFKKLN